MKWVFQELLTTRPGKEWLDRETGKIWNLNKDSRQPDVLLGALPRAGT